MTNQSLRYQRSSTPRLTADEGHANYFTWYDGPVTRVLMKKHPGYLPLNLVMHQDLLKTSMPGTWPNPDLCLPSDQISTWPLIQPTLLSLSIHFLSGHFPFPFSLTLFLWWSKLSFNRQKFIIHFSIYKSPDQTSYLPLKPSPLSSMTSPF